MQSCGMCGHNSFNGFRNVIWSEVDVVDSRRGQELGFSNIATSSLFVTANLTPLAMESQQKFFQKSSKEVINETISMFFRILEPIFLLPSLIM